MDTSKNKIFTSGQLNKGKEDDSRIRMLLLGG
jgi:hypothetical protein